MKTTVVVLPSGFVHLMLVAHLPRSRSPQPASLLPTTVVELLEPGRADHALLALAPFFLASGLMAPGWAATVPLAIWLGLFVLGLVWIRRRPLWVLPLPFVAALIWLGRMSAGGAWLGWTA